MTPPHTRKRRRVSSRDNSLPEHRADEFKDLDSSATASSTGQKGNNENTKPNTKPEAENTDPNANPEAKEKKTFRQKATQAAITAAPLLPAFAAVPGVTDFVSNTASGAKNLLTGGGNNGGGASGNNGAPLNGAGGGGPAAAAPVSLLSNSAWGGFNVRGKEVNPLAELSQNFAQQSLARPSRETTSFFDNLPTGTAPIVGGVGAAAAGGLVAHRALQGRNNTPGNKENDTPNTAQNKENDTPDSQGNRLDKKRKRPNQLT